MFIVQFGDFTQNFTWCSKEFYLEEHRNLLYSEDFQLAAYTKSSVDQKINGKCGT